MDLNIIAQEPIFKLFVSAIIGLIIGFEREIKNRSAGLRTHILVSTGACLIMLISSKAFKDSDPTRIAAQVVSGIGFLGAGSILQGNNSITGLTTAANIWVCGAIGLAVGAGMYKEAISTALIILIVLTFLNSFIKGKILKKSVQVKEREVCETVEIKEDK